eukprot:667036-Amphidinium_carterae.1
MLQLRMPVRTFIGPIKQAPEGFADFVGACQSSEDVGVHVTPPLAAQILTPPPGLMQQPDEYQGPHTSDGPRTNTGSPEFGMFENLAENGGGGPVKEQPGLPER